MAKRKIVDAVANAVVDAELGIVRTARQAVQAVNRRLGTKRKVRKAKRKLTGRKKAAKKTARRKVSRTNRTVPKAARKRPVRRVASKAHQENRPSKARPISPRTRWFPGHTPPRVSKLAAMLGHVCATPRDGGSQGRDSARRFPTSVLAFIVGDHPAIQKQPIIVDHPRRQLAGGAPIASLKRRRPGQKAVLSQIVD